MTCPSELSRLVCFLRNVDTISECFICAVGVAAQMTDVPALVMRFSVQVLLKRWSHDAFVSEHSDNKHRV